MKTKEIEVRILGKHLHFNVPENIKTEDFLEIVDFVENKFSRIKREAGDLDSFKLGLLAAVNIAEEYFSLKKENQQLKTMLTKIDQLLSPLDSDMGGDMSDGKEENQAPILFQPG
ncbi:MAG: cell division protein ZapA [Candidatus Aminicenantes bacterium]|nr:MAG: cell division protein ZapA [Candidatus Aminicenantes bacterium]